MECEYNFFDFTNLNANDRDEIKSLLKPNSCIEGLTLPWDTGENNDMEHLEPSQAQEIPKIWTHYDVEGNSVKYEAPANNPTFLFAMPNPIIHSQNLMPSIYHNEWQNMYINDPNVHSFMSYPQNMFPFNNDNQEISTMRDNGRRGRVRGGKNYSRNTNHSTEIQTSYIGDQYPVSLPQYYVYPDTHQHHTPGPVYLSSYVHHPLGQRVNHHIDYAQYPSPTNTKFIHQSQNYLPQNGDSVKNTNHKPYDKPVQNANITNPSIHQTVDVKTVIVNNSNIDSSTHDIDKNLTTTNKNSINNTFDLKIEQSIVSTLDETCTNLQRNNMPFVNIKSSIEVKQNGNDNESNENASRIKSPVENISISDLKVVDEEIKKEVENKEVQDKEEIKKISVVKNAAEVVEAPYNTSNSVVESWASILKKKNSESNIQIINKPTACIAPNNTTITNSEPNEQADKKPQLKLKSHQDNSTSEETLNKNNLPFVQCKPLDTEIPHCDDPTTYRMGEFLLSYQMDKQTVSLLPRGLTNRSNYCYINSILQALLACPPFYNLFMALPFSKNPSKHSPSPLIDNMIKFVREFTPLSEGARLARKDRAQKKNEDAIIDIQSGVPFEPSYIYGILKNTSSGIFSIEGRQEDAEEFLSCLLNGISDEMLELMKLANNNEQKSIESIENVNYNQDEDEWKVMGPKNKGSITRSTDFGRTPLSEIFRGQLRSRVHRVTEQATDYIQPFFTLQLDIEKAESVKSALKILVGKDQLEGMTCSKTKQQIEAWKQVTLEELPVILILHLKWFNYKPDGCTKIFKSVEFPIDLKIDSKFMSHGRGNLDTKQKQYKLFAVTYHDGKEATKGHYVTDAFHVGYGGWVRYDDSSVKGVSEANVLNPQPPRVPYLLYYRRCDTIRNNQSNNIKVR